MVSMKGSLDSPLRVWLKSLYPHPPRSPSVPLLGPPGGCCGIADEYLHSFCLQASDLTTKLVGLVKHPREIGVLQRFILGSGRVGNPPGKEDDAEENGVK